MQDKHKVLWKDRKRILGMPITFTRYEITADRFLLHKGLFRTETNETMLYRILDIKLVRTLWQKIFRVGTITLYSADQSHSTCSLVNIKYAQDVRRLLSDNIEQIRGRMGIAGREIYGMATTGVPANPEGDGDASNDEDMPDDMDLPGEA